MDVIVMAVRWYLAYPLSSRQVLELLAERDIDVSHRRILRWPRIPFACSEVVAAIHALGHGLRRQP